MLKEFDESSLPLSRLEIEELISDIPEARTNLKFRNDVQRIIKEHREQTDIDAVGLGSSPVVLHNTVQK